MRCEQITITNTKANDNKIKIQNHKKRKFDTSDDNDMIVMLLNLHRVIKLMKNHLSQEEELVN